MILIFFFNFKPKPMARGARGGGKGNSPRNASSGAAASGGKRGRADASQTVLEEAAAEAAAADAAAESANLEGDSDGEGDSGAGGSKRQRLPDGLLIQRLDKANAEKTEMATKLAELEKRLAERDVLAESLRPATGANAVSKVAL
jgi:hypothetical protein